MILFIQRTSVAAYRVFIATMLVIPFPTPVIRVEAVPPPAGLSAEEWAGIPRQIGQTEDHLSAAAVTPSQVKKLTAADGAAGDWFGNKVALSGDTVVAGAFGDDFRKGAAHVFARNQGGADQWGQAKKLTAANGAAGDIFGLTVTISGDYIVAGADGDDSFKGAAYVYQEAAAAAGGGVYLPLILRNHR